MDIAYELKKKSEELLTTDQELSSFLLHIRKEVIFQLDVTRERAYDDGYEVGFEAGREYGKWYG